MSERDRSSSEMAVSLANHPQLRVPLAQRPDSLSDKLLQRLSGTFIAAADVKRDRLPFMLEDSLGIAKSGTS